MTNIDLAREIKNKVDNPLSMTTKEITNVLTLAYPTLSPSTISWKINQLKQEKLIYQIGRGLYSFKYKPDYIPEISLKAKRIYNKVKPFCSGNISIWETQLLNDFTDTTIDKNWFFVSISKDDLENVFKEVSNYSKPYYLQPTKEFIGRYIIPQNDVVILDPFVSETPVIKTGDYTSPSLEAILVDLWLKNENYLKPIGIEAKDIYKIVFEKYNVNQSKLLRYANRRDKRKEINELIKTLA